MVHDLCGEDHHGRSDRDRAAAGRRGQQAAEDARIPGPLVAVHPGLDLVAIIETDVNAGSESTERPTCVAKAIACSRE